MPLSVLVSYDENLKLLYKKMENGKTTGVMANIYWTFSESVKLNLKVGIDSRTLVS